MNNGNKRFLDNKKKSMICNILAIGCSRRTAARAVACDFKTIYREIQRDPQFAEDVRKAEAGFEVRHGQRVDLAAAEVKYWRASAWALERRNPDWWGARAAKTVTPAMIEHVFIQLAVIIEKDIEDDVTRERVLGRIESVIDEVKEEEQAERAAFATDETATSQVTVSEEELTNGN